MQHDRVLEIMRRAVRTEICPECFRREPFVDDQDSTTPSPHKSRCCEPTCSIMINLRKLKKLAERSIYDSKISLEDEILHRICEKCESDETSGDYCRERTSRQCPLSRYAFDVENLLERVVKASQHTSS